MATRLRLVLLVLVLVLAYSAVFAPGEITAAQPKKHSTAQPRLQRLPRLKVPRLRHAQLHRAHLPRIKLAAAKPAVTLGDRAAKPTGQEARIAEEIDDLTRALGEAHVELRALKRGGPARMVFR